MLRTKEVWHKFHTDDQEASGIWLWYFNSDHLQACRRPYRRPADLSDGGCHRVSHDVRKAFKYLDMAHLD